MPGKFAPAGNSDHVWKRLKINFRDFFVILIILDKNAWEICPRGQFRPCLKKVKNEFTHSVNKIQPRIYLKSQFVFVKSKGLHLINWILRIVN